MVENGIGFLVRDVQTRLDIFKKESQRLEAEISQRVNVPGLKEALERLFHYKDESAIDELAKMSYMRLNNAGTELVI